MGDGLNWLDRRGKEDRKVSGGLLRPSGEMENEEEGADEGCRGEEGSVLGPGGEEEEAGGKFWHADSLFPLRQGCNLGHVSHKAFWAIHLS